ncbi:SH3 domain-containing protein [Moraxella cuniculi DSM 21768]|uniref:SH3 domain-containing protein n=1 Tax=Moraxella cuniculi DSM 21768 TaxID=1122245 RepID=A0A1N7EHI7_9GAMM|nr:SH3 domain-containing protein [Moraxella cuniculi]OOS07276.1 hypothetical protein B0189_03720 [Moraxella cuniculi]SIR87520.1 SH3 domain-containing protein [Moraxella cuniculi DSM 21768]
MNIKLIAFALIGTLGALTANANQYTLQSGSAYIQTKTDGYVYMRNAPHPNATRIQRLNDYTDVQVLSCEGRTVRRTDVAAHGQKGKWCRVSANGRTGYVFSPYLRYY